MRLHRHHVGSAVRWHSVRLRHQDMWDWCAHHEEVERRPHPQRRSTLSLTRDQTLKLRAAG